jgi:hypothetical protein
MIPSRDKVAAAKLLGELLGVPWSETSVGPFSAVYVNNGLTFDFDEWTEPIPQIHFCFRVSEDQFDAILESAAVIDVEHAANASRDLDRIIEVSDALVKSRAKVKTSH